MLRLPPEMPKEEKMRKVEAVITELNLVKCANTPIGNQFVRGVSGGERKRTAIGKGERERRIERKRERRRDAETDSDHTQREGEEIVRERRREILTFKRPLVKEAVNLVPPSPSLTFLIAFRC
jgi:hypothetical protein